MTRRRILETAVAATVLVLLLAVLLVRSTSKRTAPPIAVAIPLFERVPGAPPDFTSGSYSARIVPSPDSTRFAVLYPDEWEERADLYLIDARGEGYRLVLGDLESVESTPKNLGWLDPQMLWVTVGYMFGTVAPGGDLYVLDPATGRGVALWTGPADGRVQATDLEGQSGRYLVRGQVFDARMNHPRDTTWTAPSAFVEAARQALAERLD